MKLQSPRWSDGIKTDVQESFGGINNTDGARDGDIISAHNMTSDSFPVMSTRGAREDYEPAKIICDAFSTECIEREGAYDVADRVVYLGRSGGGFYAAFEAEGQVYKSDMFLYGADKYSAVSFNRELLVYSDAGNVSIGFDEKNKKISITELDFKTKVRIAVASDKNAGVSYIRIDTKDCFMTAGKVYTYQYSDRKPFRFKVHSAEVMERIDIGNSTIIEVDYDSRFNVSSKLDEVLGEDEEGVEYYEATIGVDIPEFDCVCVNGDRVFAVSENKIYCSCSCDAASWYDYDITTAARSFFAQIPAVSRFVGLTSYLGDVFFFTTEDVYRLYGTTPDTFSLVPLGTYGLEKSSSDSFGIAGQRLFYVSPYGPVSFNGDVARLCGCELGRTEIKAAHGIGVGSKYYLSDGKLLYVYDSERKMWHTEDGEGIVSMLIVDGELVLFYGNGDALCHRVHRDARLGGSVTSKVEFADFTEGSVGHIGTGEFALKTWLGAGASLSLYISCDGGAYEKIWTCKDPGLHINTVRYAPRVRCESYRLKLSGCGSWKLYMLKRSFRYESNIRYGG